LNENNILNNYAIRPIIVGSPVLPGGITVAGSTSLQNCPTQKLIFTGHADYFGTSIPTSVAGAEVTINTGSAILKTTTDANGNYNLVMENPPCGGTLTYTVSVTDFTFTSSLFTGAQAISCPAPNACMPPPNFTGGITVGILTTPCSSIVGGTSQATLTIKYRERNIANMWSSWDKIWKDTVKVFNNGVLIQTYYTNDVPDFGSVGTFPGDVKVIPVNIPLGSTGPNNITVVATYVYNEFLQIPTSIHHGSFTQMTATAGSTIIAEPNKPNLSLGNFIQTSYRSFTFQDNNTECAAAGSHLVRIVDVTVPGSPVTVQTNTVTGVAGKSHATLSANFPSLLPGVYQFRIITDTTELVDETDETNNAVLVTLTVPEPDLTISKISSSPTDLPQNASVSFKATINNSGVAAGPFTVRFLANGVPIGGDIPVSSIIEKGELTVTSNIFTVPTAEIDCPINITVIVDAGSMINESNESNNSATIPLGSDIVPLQLQGESGSSSNPERVRVNTSKHFNAYIRNTGSRDIHNVTVKFMHKGIKIGEALVPLIKAGIGFPAVASFTHTFTNPGKDTVEVFTDTANLVCEIDDNNNTGLYHIVVTDSKEDFVVLSQYISPSSLNPNANQNISIVGTVKNIGNKVSPQSNMRFYVDNIQLGSAVPFNSLQIGQDTTVAATVTYSSQIAGIKVIKITVDEETLVSEEDENNNLATRTIIVGDAPDMTRSITQPISFNPNGFNAGDSVTIAYQLRNNGTNGGTAWVRFKVFDAAGSLTAIDSVAFTLAPGSNTTLSRRMHFVIDSGFVVTEIVNCTPFESNLLNNSDTLYFSTVAKMKTNLIVNNLDMKAGAPQQLPGWIGGKIVLGDYDLIVNGNIVNFDTAHFVVTNGSGKLKIINGNAQNIFPVGANLYRTNFAKINNIGTTDNFSVRVLPYVLRNGTSGDTIRTSNVNRTWMIDEDIAGGSNGTVEMFWNASDELPGFDRTASRTAHFISNWQLSGPGNALVDTNGIFSRAQAGYTSFSPFTVTSGTTVLIPLRFIEFTAVPNGKDVLLKWITEAEQNTSHFDVEFSTDGAGFTAIGKVNSANTGGQHRYEFTHQSPIGNTLYYRIRQVDLDGRYTYSKVVRVNVVTATNITLSPNPARNFIQLHNVDRNELREIRIVGMDGKLIQMNSNNSQMLIDIQQLKNGYYVLQVIKKDGSTVNLSFVKQ
jgi:subtilase family serine protease